MVRQNREIHDVSTLFSVLYLVQQQQVIPNDFLQKMVKKKHCQLDDDDLDISIPNRELIKMSLKIVHRGVSLPTFRFYQHDQPAYTMIVL